MDLFELRREYTHSGLARCDLLAEPLDQFAAWFSTVQACDLDIPNAMTLATVDAHGMPALRTVLLKAVEQSGLVFFTHYNSQKGRDLAANPQAALLFQWLGLERQIKVQGRVEKIDVAESSGYFASRPRGSQLAVWCAQQSTVVEDRATLLTAFREVEARFANQDVPMPEDWGGYRLLPDRFEFWQGRENRLHDRFVYQRVDQMWEIQRLAP